MKKITKYRSLLIGAMSILIISAIWIVWNNNQNNNNAYQANSTIKYKNFTIDIPPSYTYESIDDNEFRLISKSYAINVGIMIDKNKIILNKSDIFKKALNKSNLNASDGTIDNIDGYDIVSFYIDDTYPMIIHYVYLFNTYVAEIKISSSDETIFPTALNEILTILKTIKSNEQEFTKQSFYVVSLEDMEQYLGEKETTVDTNNVK